MPAGGSCAVDADPGPQILLVQRGGGSAFTDSSAQLPEVSSTLHVCSKLSWLFYSRHALFVNHSGGGVPSQLFAVSTRGHLQAVF